MRKPRAVTFSDLPLLIVSGSSVVGRRQALRLAVLAAAAVGAPTVVSRLVHAPPAAADDGSVFDEILAGRRIRGRLELRGGRLVPVLYIDGVELHIMRGRDGYTSSVNHYQSYPTARRAARAAVRSLNGARLLHRHN